MSDEPDTTAAESAEAAQGAVTDEAPSTEAPPPWGEDFSPERAWQTITHLRGREKELEPHHKTLERLQSGEDLDTFRRLAEKYGFEVPDEVEDELEDDGGEEDPRDQQLKQLEERLSRQEQQYVERTRREQWAGWTDHVKQLADAEGYELSERDLKRLAFESADEANFPIEPAAAKKILSDYLAESEEIAKARMERWKSSKKAPHVSPAGKAGSGPKPDLTTTQGREAYFRERLGGTTT